MNEVALTLLVVVLGLARLGVRVRERTPGERVAFGVCFAAHCLSSFALVELTRRFYEGGGDMFTYHAIGTLIVDLIHADPAYYLVENLKLFLHQEPDFPFTVVGAGSGTGSIVASTAFLLWITGGSIYATSLAFGLLAWEGQILIYDGIRGEIPQRSWPRLRVGLLFVPSVVFWSSGIVKEAAAIFGLGLLTRALSLAGRANGRALPLGLIGAGIVGGVKGYVLFAFVGGAAAWFYAGRGQGAGRSVLGGLPRPLRLILLAAGSVAAIVALGWLLPRFALENVVEEADRLRASASRIEAGSNFDLVDPEAGATGRGLVVVPLALLTSLFRPFPWEAGNVLALASALEVSVLALLLALASVRARPAALWKLLRGNRALLFSVAFVIALAIPLGLSTGNLGTLSRYRIPLMPFYAAVVLMLSDSRLAVCSRRGARRASTLEAAVPSSS